MTDHEAYFAYLKRRSRLALLYRRSFLYPRLCRHLKGEALDVGCGMGDMLAFRPRTVGVDVNPHAVAFCRQRGLNAVSMEPDRLPFDAARCDSATLDNVLEHLDEPRPLLSEIYRVLKPGGVLVVGVPGRRGYDWDADHKVFYDEAALRSTLQGAGFSTRSVFHVPWHSEVLSSRLRQYCLYASFDRP